jgi:hypothetical protein
MKHTWLLTPLVALAFLAACKPSSSSEIKQTAVQSPPKPAVAQTPLAADAAMARQYAFSEKAEFLTATRLEMVELNRGVEDAAARLARSDQKLQQDIAPKLTLLRDQAANLDRKLQDIASAGSENWVALRNDLTAGFASLRKGLALSKEWTTPANKT